MEKGWRKNAERVHVQNCSDSLAGFGFSFKIEFTLLDALRKSIKTPLENVPFRQKITSLLVLNFKFYIIFGNARF